ncbi:hypothetical protein LGT39_01660, partial [Demequina sp. TTPB684]
GSAVGSLRGWAGLTVLAAAVTVGGLDREQTRPGAVASHLPPSAYVKNIRRQQSGLEPWEA